MSTAGISISIIVVTDHDDAITLARARSAGTYLRKPFREDALIGAIQQVLGQS